MSRTWIYSLGTISVTETDDSFSALVFLPLTHLMTCGDLLLMLWDFEQRCIRDLRNASEIWENNKEQMSVYDF